MRSSELRIRRPHRPTDVPRARIRKHIRRLTHIDRNRRGAVERSCSQSAEIARHHIAAPRYLDTDYRVGRGGIGEYELLIRGCQRHRGVVRAAVHRHVDCGAAEIALAPECIGVGPGAFNCGQQDRVGSRCRAAREFRRAARRAVRAGVCAERHRRAEHIGAAHRAPDRRRGAKEFGTRTIGLVAIRPVRIYRRSSRNASSSSLDRSASRLRNHVAGNGIAVQRVEVLDAIYSYAVVRCGEYADADVFRWVLIGLAGDIF